MTDRLHIPIDLDRIADICRRWKIAEFSLLGSVLREDFRPDSDVDVLISFAPNHRWSLLEVVDLKAELDFCSVGLWIWRSRAACGIRSNATRFSRRAGFCMPPEEPLGLSSLRQNSPGRRFDLRFENQCGRAVGDQARLTRRDDWRKNRCYQRFYV
jgi:predicted nucleotidyltransferase